MANWRRGCVAALALLVSALLLVGLLAAVGLLVLDTYAKRVRLFGYRTIRFR